MSAKAILHSSLPRQPVARDGIARAVQFEGIRVEEEIPDSRVL